MPRRISGKIYIDHITSHITEVLRQQLPCGDKTRVQHDNWAHEIGFEIWNTDDNVLVEQGQLWGPNNSLTQNTFNLPPACYELKMIDQYGDGIENGHFTLVNQEDNTTLIPQTNFIGNLINQVYSESFSFCVAPSQNMPPIINRQTELGNETDVQHIQTLYQICST